VSFPRYEKYKNSGVEWLGDVPVHWEVKRLKYSLRLLTEKTDRREHPIALENIEGWTGRFIPTETKFEGEGIAFNADDILFGKLRPYLAKVYRTESSGEAVGDFHVMRPVEGIESRYAQYQMLNHEFIAIVDGSTFGSKMPRASWEFVGGMKITTPPPVEQSAISSFLDHETAKIDALVAEQERLIELLKEKRQAVISHAVTKGLNPQAPLKSSGIDWLCDVPEHWKITKLKYVVTFKGGGTPSKENLSFWNGVIPWVSPKDMKSDDINETEDTISQTAIDESSTSLISEPAVLMVVRSGILQRTIPVGINRVPVTLNQDMKALIPNQKSLSPDYLRAWIWGLEPELLQLWMKQGATVESLEHEYVRETPLAIPPISEQESIIKFVHEEKNKFDALIDKSVASIALLKERRSALISAAVTGKIDVRDLVKKDDILSLSASNDNSMRSIAFGYIANELCVGRSWGQIDQMKAFYLFEVHFGRSNVLREYERAAAGPYNGEVLDTNNNIGVQQGWFSITQKPDDSRVYSRSKNSPQCKKEFEEKFSAEASSINAFIGLLKGIKDGEIEICATLYDCWLSFSSKQVAITEDDLIETFYSYSPRKKMFSMSEVRKVLVWMKKNKLTPEQHKTFHGYSDFNLADEKQQGLFSK
jgi:type I restriction enzyme S subunit